MSGDTIQASKYLGIRRYGKKPARITEERRCHCGTKLASYNPNDTCWLHSPVEYRRTRGAAPSPDK